MRRMATLILLVPAILAGQSASLDEGRLDSTWFGAGVVFQPSKELGFLWMKPGLDLQKRTLRLRKWEPAIWLLGKRETKDQLFLMRMEQVLEPDLGKRLRRGLKEALPITSQSGEVVLVGRVVDALGVADDGSMSGSMALTFDLKLVDGDSGELLGAFHTTLAGPGIDSVSGQYWRWCENLGRLLAKSATAPVAASPVPALAPVQPAFDLEGALRRIEGLKRDGLLSEEECQLLRSKAAERAKGL